MLICTTLCTIFSEPEERVFQSKTGDTVYSYSMRAWAKISKETTQWVDISFKRHLCEGMIHHLKRGAVILASGDLRVSTYLSRLDGCQKVHIRIYANSIKIIKFPPRPVVETPPEPIIEDQTDRDSYREPIMSKDPDMFDDSECPF